MLPLHVFKEKALYHLRCLQMCLNNLDDAIRRKFQNGG